jgi:hypothetical protein
MEEISEQSYDSMEAYLLAKEKASEKLDQASQNLNNAIEEFAKNNNVKLIFQQSDNVKNLEIANSVWTYYNKIYLIFFKSNKQEFYLIDSMNKANINDLEQNRLTLIKNSEEGLVKLKNLEIFKNDETVKNNCENALNFYKDEAGEKFLIITDFFMKKDLYDKVKKAYDLKNKNDITKDDVDQINSTAKDYNNSVANFNKINKELNIERQKITVSWNNTSKLFIDKFIPN